MDSYCASALDKIMFTVIPTPPRKPPTVLASNKKCVLIYLYEYSELKKEKDTEKS